MSGRGASSAGGLILAIDQGTTNTKALIVKPATGDVVAAASRPVGIAFPRPGWVEQDAAQLWSATAEAVADCLAASPRVPDALAISSQRETAVAWSRRTGRPLGPALGWQDARTVSICEGLAAHAGTVRKRTGLSLDPMYSAPKMRWLLDGALAGGADPGEVLVGTVDAWLLWQLTGRHLTEAGNASRTLLFGLDTLAWEPGLLELFGVPESALPRVLASDGDFGATVESSGLPVGIPVAAVLADSHAALYQHGCTHPGVGKATYGTGSSVMTPCEGPEPAPAGIAATLAWLVDGRPTYAREGNIVASGSALDWMAGVLGGPPGGSGGQYLTALAGTVRDAGGVAFVPAFSGLGAPYWDRSATALLAGVTGGTTAAHLAWAALESVAHQVVDVVEAIESDGRAAIATLHADGGATASTVLMQMQANLLGREVRVADVREASALGAARLAAERLGMPVPAPAAGAGVAPESEVPRSELRRAWARAVARSRGLPVEPEGT